MRCRQKSSPLRLESLNSRATRGRLRCGWLALPCSLGRSGRSVAKREGDGATPSGRWRLREVLYRPDRVARPSTGLPVRPIRALDGWCDAIGDRNYNRAVRHPYPASAETLWRADALYDVVVVVSYNEQPRVQGRGSAIFLHIERPDRGPTAGCVAVTLCDMRRLLAVLGPGARLVVPAG